MDLIGKIAYDPYRVIPCTGKTMRKTHKERTAIVTLPRDGLADYYRALVSNQFGIFMQAPLFGAHMTIVGGNEFRHIKNISTWNKYANEKIKLCVHPEKIYRAWKFWVLPVEDVNGIFTDIRHELGLTKPVNFHITIGREYEQEEYPSPRPEVIVPYNLLSNGCS